MMKLMIFPVSLSVSKRVKIACFQNTSILDAQQTRKFL